MNKMWMWTKRGVLLLFLMVSVSGPVVAQEVDPVKFDEDVKRLSKAGKYAEAIPFAVRALKLRESTLGPDNPKIVKSLTVLALLYQKTSQHGESEPLLRRVLEIYANVLSPDHPNVASALNFLAQVYVKQGRYAQAEPLFQRSLKIREKALPPDHSYVASSLNNLAYAYTKLGRYAQAEPLFQRSLKIREKALGPDHPDVATSLHNLAGLYTKLGRYAQAEPLIQRSLKIREKALGSDHPDVATSLSNLANAYRGLGRYAQAEPLYKRSLKIREKALGPDHPSVVTSLSNLAGLMRVQGREAAVEALYKRSLKIAENALGGDHPAVGSVLGNLAMLYLDQERYDDAEPLLKRSLKIKKALGPNHPGFAGGLVRLAGLYLDQGRYAEAEPLFQRSLRIFGKVLGPNHPDVGTVLTNLATLYQAQGRLDAAESALKRSLKISEALGPDHPLIVKRRDFLGNQAFFQKNWRQASGHWLRATDIIVRRTRTGTIEQSLTGKKKSEAARNDRLFRLLVKSVYRDKAASKDALRGMFLTAQWAVNSDAAAALAKMTARQASGDGALAKLVRQRQDLISEWQQRDKRQITDLSKPPGKRNKKAEAANVSRLAAIDDEIAKINKRLAKDFPDYAAIANPEPLSIKDVQARLNNDEALVLIVDTPKWSPAPSETFVWVVSKSDSLWVRSALGTKDLEQMVHQLRRGTDPTTNDRGLVRAETCRTDGGASSDDCSDSTFDFDVAYKLYTELLKPAERLINDKKHLIIVPSGPLSALPPQLMLTAPAPAAASDGDRLKSAPWLIRRHSVTVLPSVASLKVLRRNAKGTQTRASDSFLGIGDPVFIRPSDETGNQAPADTAAPRAFSSYFRGGQANLEELSGKIPPLPDSAFELQKISKTLGLSSSKIILRRDASETTIKSMNDAGTLADYSIVQFATHGLVAGEIENLAEPALALSLPDEASDENDGLLTASEVTQLKLDADWVVLSACNTAAAETPGAEALSGLARAFFYAGTKSLLVSHWPVVSEAATSLTTNTFSVLKEDPTIGKSEALRRSMLALIDNGDDRQAHPSYWAPFVVVGEGAAK